MDFTHDNLPQDLDSCHALIRALWKDREQAVEDQRQQEAVITQQQETIDQLVAERTLLKRCLFGSRRERFIDDPRQRYLFDTTEESLDETPSVPEEEPPKAKPRRTSKGRKRRVFPDFLPRETVEHKLDDDEIPEDLRNDPSAKRFWKQTNETLDYQPPKLTVLVHYQEVIVANDETDETRMATASKPSRLIDAYVEPGFLAYLTASRFADHLPYYRLEDILSRYGFRIGRNTQCRWMHDLAVGVQPLVDLMRQRVLLSLILGVDETPVRLLRSAGMGSINSYLWGTVGDCSHPYDCFYFTTGRGRAGPEAFLSGFRGYLQSDAYICYEQIAALREEVQFVSCWAHARRKFEEVHFTGPSVRTQMAMAYFQRLYEIEGRAAELNDADRYALRQRESKPIVLTFHEWLTEQYDRELPKSKLRGAIGYMTNRWDSFARYLEHGAIPIDNNRTEASLKYAILGRKAWLFFGNEAGGDTAATLFTLTKSCNRHHVDPYAYLRDVYTRLPTISSESELELLLPDNWIAAHPEHRIQERVDEAMARARRKRERRALRRQASLG